jgi:hypothetical protein
MADKPHPDLGKISKSLLICFTNSEFFLRNIVYIIYSIIKNT